ncbi:cobyrinate a,c-diamide synthase [Candidatus Nitrosotenuis sp. DW1]|uniref:cobyrinate a,c-diamide synthase n=1 Tax=Candidatus Nitrosotenuis sp. DW1 TaxID=2259672 RepID=UPI0015CC2A35|nr:cobyrinate a,c-diamide synthase [Candidatus Nitrosotenuis sp. DW1]QLH09757.1 cobyrinic acid a,c-diamide synthase [Candidatus Nitrosotenuis sp. DW1]
MIRKNKIPRILIAGVTSGVGKTSITCSIIHGMIDNGYSVQPFKVGPDYIDPTYLSAISGNNARNLDSWIMGKEAVVQSFLKNSNSEISVIEGVMGFYDGFSGTSNFSSTHHIASILQAPVILVLDASKTARSIAATALGYTKFHRNSRIVGFILNKIGSKKHEEMCRGALSSLKIPILGIIPKNSEFDIQSRHLGLIPVIEQNELKQKIKKIAKKISGYLDIDGIISAAKQASPFLQASKELQTRYRVKIGVALDKSFNFYYYDNFDALRREGAKIEFFSPISDPVPPKCDGLYIGGGFPEVLGQLLTKNHTMKKSIKSLAEQGMPIYAECGGLMYLTKSIEYGDKKYSTVGLFDAETTMEKKMTLNYTKAQVISDCIVAKKSTKLFGHEFHYSELKSIPKDSKFAYELSIGVGINGKKDGLLEYNTLASYMHLYFDRNNYPYNFVKNCIKFSAR